MWTIEQGFITLTPGLSTYALPTDTIDLLDHVIRTQANVSSTQSDLSITRISVSTYATIPNKLAQGRPIQVWIQRLSGETNPSGKVTVGALSATDTSITLDSVDGLAGSGFIRLESEDIYYGYIAGNVLGGIFRGQNNTTAATHVTATKVYVPQLPAVTVWPTPDSSQTYQFVYYRMRRIQDTGSGIQVQDMNFRFLPAVAAGLAYYIAMKTPELAPRIDMLKQVYDEQFNLAAGEDHEKATLRLVPRISFISNGGY
jgi:hypothetical protein